MRHQDPSIYTARRQAGIHRSRGRSGRHRRPAPVAAFRQDRRAAAKPRNLTAPAARDPLTLGAATWLACGIVLLGLTPLPLRDAQLGWSFTFWALAAPLLLLLARYACVGKSRSLQTIRPKRLS